MFSEEAQELVGVDITPVLGEELEDKKGINTTFELCTRCAMGLNILSNHAIQFYLHAEEFILGDLADI